MPALSAVGVLCAATGLATGVDCSDDGSNESSNSLAEEMTSSVRA
jgi:hypothetical protein